MNTARKRIVTIIAGICSCCVLITPAFAAKKEAAPAAAPAEKKPGVVAVVNGSEIGLDEFNRELYRAERAVLDGGRVLTSIQVKKFRDQVLEGLIRQELLYLEGKKTIRVSDSEVAAEVDKLKSQFQSTADFEKASPVLRVQVAQGLTIAKYIDTAYSSKADVSDNDVRTYYDNNRDKFRQPEQVKAGYILVKADPNGDEGKKKDARKKIDAVREKAVSGKDFADLARTNSDDPTATQGGDVGYVRQGQLLKPIEDALFVLKPGEVSPVVETPVGYNLVKAYERKPETTTPFEEVKDKLHTLLQKEKGQQEAFAYIATVREKAAVQTSLPAEE